MGSIVIQPVRTTVLCAIFVCGQWRPPTTRRLRRTAAAHERTWGADITEQAEMWTKPRS